MRTTESSLNFSRRFAASALGLLLRFFFFFFLFLFLHLLIISLLLHTNNRPAGSAQPGLETAATGDVDQGVHAMAAASVWGSLDQTAALVVEVDRALNMPETAPAHVATANRVAKEFWRWGWRANYNARVPLAWNPTWMRDTLTEDGIIEAWQLYIQIAKVRTRTSNEGSGAVDALADRYRMPTDPEGADAPIWEREGRTYGRRLARLGGTLRRHFLADNGGWRTEKELGEYLGRGGRIVGGRQIRAKLTTAEAREYQTLLQQTNLY